MKSTKRNKLVLFDLDGTLVKAGHPTARKSVIKAIKKVFNIDVVIDWFKHDGSTDRKIMVDVLQEKGIKKEEVESKINQLIKARVDFFSTHVESSYKKRLIPEAVDLIKKLKEKGIFIGLLTGNFKTMAFRKLKISGIDYLFDFGLFGEMAEDRNELAGLVFKKAKQHFGINFLPEDIFIIGDTIHDIKCGKAIGGVTIGVATGFSSSKKDLKKASADLVVDSLDDKRVLEFILK